jgi:hypothetical protein
MSFMVDDVAALNFQKHFVLVFSLDSTYAAAALDLAFVFVVSLDSTAVVVIVVKVASRPRMN